MLKSKISDKYLLVGNTHLYSQADADHVRVLQIGQSMVFMEHILEKTIADHNLTPSQATIVFCGDFNSTPECGIYKLMTEKFVPEDYIGFQSSECYRCIQFSRMKLSFRFRFGGSHHGNESASTI